MAAMLGHTDFLDSKTADYEKIPTTFNNAKR